MCPGAFAKEFGEDVRRNLPFRAEVWADCRGQALGGLRGPEQREGDRSAYVGHLKRICHRSHDPAEVNEGPAKIEEHERPGRHGIDLNVLSRHPTKPDIKSGIYLTSLIRVGTERGSRTHRWSVGSSKSSLKRPSSRRQRGSSSLRSRSTETGGTPGPKRSSCSAAFSRASTRLAIGCSSTPYRMCTRVSRRS